MGVILFLHGQQIETFALLFTLRHVETIVFPMAAFKSFHSLLEGNATVNIDNSQPTKTRAQDHSYARFTLADPMPRLCPDAVGSANVNGLPTWNRPPGPHREAIGRSSGNIKHV